MRISLFRRRRAMRWREVVPPEEVVPDYWDAEDAALLDEPVDPIIVDDEPPVDPRAVVLARGFNELAGYVRTFAETTPPGAAERTYVEGLPYIDWTAPEED